MSTSSAPRVHSYHCICTTPVLITSQSLSKFTHRSPPVQDQALIIPLSSSPPSHIHNLDADKRPTIIVREDGFEKRLLLRCTRCQVVVGYKLAESHFEDAATAEEVVYILPGGLIETGDMILGKGPEETSWSEGTTALV